MSLNEQKGNMYNFVSHTWNTIKGECSHDCLYCYMKRWGKLNPVRFDRGELNVDLGENNFIFVGSSNDMFADSIDPRWISATLDHCMKYENNKYLFQSKNPAKMFEYVFPRERVLCATIETNRDYKISKAPSVNLRAYAIKELKRKENYKTMITIEPIIDFDLSEMVDLIKTANPDYINIGACTGGHGLPEPSKGKVKELIEALSEINVNLKSNLKRLTK